MQRYKHIAHHYLFRILFSFLNSSFFSDVFPSPFEGARIVVNKGLSNHFQISHSLQLTSGPSSGYRFGATYVGTHQVSPTEAYPVLLGDIDPNGNLNANVLLQAAENCRFKFQAQVVIFFPNYRMVEN